MDTLSILLLCGAVAGPLFILTFLIEGYLRPNYNSWRSPVSVLSQGSRGWVQQLNFFITGALLVAFAWGLHLALAEHNAFWAPLMMFFYGAGLLGAGLFVTDHDMPPSNTRSGHSASGSLHDLFSSVVFISLSIECFVFAHLFSLLDAPGLEIYSIITGLLYLLGFVVFAVAFSPTSKLAPLAGILQRLTISLGAIWVSFIAIHFL